MLVDDHGDPGALAVGVEQLEAGALLLHQDDPEALAVGTGGEDGARSAQYPEKVQGLPPQRIGRRLPACGLLGCNDDFFDLLSNNIEIVKALFRQLLRPPRLARRDAAAPEEGREPSPVAAS